MSTSDDDFKKYVATLNELNDRMLKAGLIISHAHTKDTGVSNYTPIGLSFITAIDGLDEMLGHLSPEQVLCLWNHFTQIGKRLRERGGQ